VKSIAAETTMQQQELSLNDTLTKVVKRKPNGKKP
jgi:hypothetical protein